MTIEVIVTSLLNSSNEIFLKKEQSREINCGTTVVKQYIFIHIYIPMLSLSELNVVTQAD